MDFFKLTILRKLNISNDIHSHLQQLNRKGIRRKNWSISKPSNFIDHQAIRNRHKFVRIESN